MKKNIKISILSVVIVIVIVIAIMVASLYIYKRNESRDIFLEGQVVKMMEQEKMDVEVGETKNILVDGKLQSMSEKQISLELADGSGMAININPGIPVSVEGEEQKKRISFLKSGMLLNVEVDKDQNATGITVKKLTN